MILDHCLLIANVAHPIRATVTRLAVPLFFVISGHLVRRFSMRTFGIGIIGLALPIAVPFVDNPNVLLWYASGAALVVLSRRYSWAPWVIMAYVFTLSANFFLQSNWNDSYWAPALYGLMVMGSVMPRSVFASLHFERLPNWVAIIGRIPLRIYVGHLLLLTVIYQILLSHGYYT
jgi:surface polysaccharide O-acyltransferase-like enzyme